jgi:hypothetical protein
LCSIAPLVWALFPACLKADPANDFCSALEDELPKALPAADATRGEVCLLLFAIVTPLLFQYTRRAATLELTAETAIDRRTEEGDDCLYTPSLTSSPFLLHDYSLSPGASAIYRDPYGKGEAPL